MSSGTVDRGLRLTLNVAFLTIGAWWFPAIAAETPDPYIWLENVDSKQALEWVRRQNSPTIKEIEARPEFSPLLNRLSSINNSSARIPSINEIGTYLYNFWRDNKNPRGLWRRTTTAEFRKEAPRWRTVVDLDQLSREENENWVWKGTVCLPRSGERCLLLLSRGGSDAVVIREFDMKSLTFVDNGFYLPEAHSRATWRSRDTLLVATDLGPDTLTKSGYPRILKAWRRGTAIADSETVFSAQRSDLIVTAVSTFWTGAEKEFVLRIIDQQNSEVYLRRDSELVKLDVPKDAIFEQFQTQLLITLRSDWHVAGRTYPSGALLATDFESFLSGQRRFEILFLPANRFALDSIHLLRDYLIVNELDNLRPRLRSFSLKDGRWSQQTVSMPQTAVAGVAAMDSYESNDFRLVTTGALAPNSLYFGNADAQQLELIKQLPSFFDTSSLEVTQHEAASKDGTRVPYFQVARKDLKLDGSHPTLLSGYGGFEVSQLPNYNAAVGAAWLERGGVYVLANGRGGGEFGPQWHQAAIKEHRQRSFDDFIAVAEDLVSRKVTSPAHLGVMGGSNGGLLVGVVVTQRPELVAAAVCQVPLLDMRRYSKLMAGASWIAEFGDPDQPNEWSYISRYSPYQNVRRGVHYPRVLFMTSTRDDRVHPGHARKMVARMNEQGHDVLYYENVEGGHGGAANNAQRAYMATMSYVFLFNELSRN